MNLTSSEATQYLARLRPLLADITDRDLFVLPAFPVLSVAREMLAGSNVAWGAQDVHPMDSGPFTGDVSAPMLADLGCQYVEVGHFERRLHHAETARDIAAKVAAVLRWGMTSIVCVGETRRSSPKDALAEITPDLEVILSDVSASALHRVVIAYEPLWAIGRGAAAAPPDHVAQVHAGIHQWLTRRAPTGPTRVIYGGSVSESTAGWLLSQPGVNGLFVGRHALDPEAFAAIAHASIAPSSPQ